MALPEINTGYRPEFGLGALYQGFNAGNASTGAELELIKQFLANQRSQEMNPLEADRKRQEISMDQYKTDPNYQNNMQRIQQGQADSQTAAGELAQGLLPFRQAKEQSELQSAEKEGNLFNKFFQARQDQFTTGKSEQEQMAAAQMAQALGDSLSRTPKQMGQERIADNKGEYALLIAELNAQHAAELARLRSEKSGPEKLSAEQAAVRRIMSLVSSGEITTAQGDTAMWELFNRRTAKSEQAGVTGEVDASGDLSLRNKPNVPLATPPSGKPSQSDSDLINKYLK